MGQLNKHSSLRKGINLSERMREWGENRPGPTLDAYRSQRAQTLAGIMNGLESGWSKSLRKNEEKEGSYFCYALKGVG